MAPIPSMPVAAAEKSLRLLLRFWIIAFTSATLVFFLFEPQLLDQFNALSRTVFPNLPLIPVPTETPSFWVPLVGSLMVTLIAICWWVQGGVRDRLIGANVLLLSKFLSSLFFFLLFAFESRYIAYLASSAVDGSIFLVTFYFVRRLRQALSQGRG